MKEITESIDDIWLAKLVLYETHNMRKVGFTHILTIDHFRHERSSQSVYNVTTCL
jgi:hypothetical protein